MPKHKTQRQLAEEGRARETARFKKNFIATYDTNPRLCASFVRGLTRHEAPPDQTYAQILEEFITENNLQGHLLREALTSLP